MPELRRYQYDDAVFLSKHKTAACFNEQRTGKTPTALTITKMKHLSKILIICPASAIPQWKEEFELWLQKPCQIAIGTRDNKQKAIDAWTNGLIISYDSFKTTLKSEGFIKDIMKKNPEMVILDEAHRIKTPKSAAAKAVFSTIQIPHRLALTATPAPGKAHEVWSILHWLKPEEFKSYWSFIEEYFKTAKRFATGNRTFIEIQGFKKNKDEQLQTILKDFSTQRKRKEVMPWLPEKDYQPIRLEATKEQTKYLIELQNYFETEDIVVHGVLDRLIRYRQICLHPALLNLKGNSPKLDWIKMYVADYSEPLIIFSKFTSFLKILDKELQDIPHAVIIGDTPILKRNEAKKMFQEGLIKVLLINIDAGKEALTLDTAETVIFTDKYPPIGDIQQAEDRFVATTQDKASKPHKIIELMIKDTYDETIYALLKERKTETDIINDYKKLLKLKKV